MVYDGVTATGAAVSITQNQPKVAAEDYHSLAELAVESTDQNQIVEIGWIVAQDVNGDSLTHLFVYHWVNGNGGANTSSTLSYDTLGAPAVYKTGHYNAACTTSCHMNFGGPGY